MSNNSREYLKIAKPAPISALDRQLKGRPAKREEVRQTLKMARWRVTRKYHGVVPKLSWSKRMDILSGLLVRGEYARR